MSFILDLRLYGFSLPTQRQNRNTKQGKGNKGNGKQGKIGSNEAFNLLNENEKVHHYTGLDQKRNTTSYAYGLRKAHTMALNKTVISNRICVCARLQKSQKKNYSNLMGRNTHKQFHSLTYMKTNNFYNTQQLKADELQI